MKKVIVVGGDGFCGWPLSLRLSNNGYNVCIIDNLSRRQIDLELSSNSLTPISSIEDRINTWKEITGKIIEYINIDIANNYEDLCSFLSEYKPDVIIHLGEQRAAPYSMKNNKTKRYTVHNNLNGTHNLLCAIVDVDKDIHFIHLGTMGVYGYGTIPNTVIPEGYINVKMTDSYNQEKSVEILHPSYPGSIYHMTKTQDALFFQFYAKNYQLKITDLHQGIIWGAHTKETILNDKLINRLDYDSDYGTALNRFIIQSCIEHPITIYGSGEQTRAFIHIENSMDCIELAIKNPPNKGDRVKIFNQVTDTHKLIDLANMIKNIYGTEINHIKNPRNELSSNELNVSNSQFLNLGLEPIKLDREHIIELYDIISKYKSNINIKNILPSSFW